MSNETQVEISKLRKQLSDLKISHNSLAKEVESLRLKIAENEKEMDGSTKTIRVLKAENQTLSGQVEYYKPYKARYENALTMLPNGVTGWKLILAGIKRLFKRG